MSWSAGTAFDRPSLLHSPGQTSPTTGTGTPGGDDGLGDHGGRKRKRSEVVSESGDPLNTPDGRASVGSAGSPATGKAGRHQPGVKRACNDCRQQKVQEHGADAAWAEQC